MEKKQYQLESSIQRPNRNPFTLTEIPKTPKDLSMFVFQPRLIIIIKKFDGAQLRTRYEYGDGYCMSEVFNRQRPTQYIYNM